MPCQHEKHGAPRVQAVGGVAKHVGVCAPCHCEQSVARDRGRPGVGPEQSPGGIARSGVLSEEARPARQGLNVHLDGVGLAADAADEVLEGEVVGDPSLDRDDLVHVDPAVSAGAGGAHVPDIVTDGRVASQLQLARGPIGVTESPDSGLGRRGRHCPSPSCRAEGPHSPHRSGLGRRGPYRGRRGHKERGKRISSSLSVTVERK